MTKQKQPGEPKPVIKADLGTVVSDDQVPEVRQWTFTSINPGLHQVLFPGRYDKEGRMEVPVIEADFGGDTGKMGIWRTTERSEAEALRNQMRKKTVADFNITETTLDPVNGDLVAKPEETVDAEPQSSAQPGS